jgi:hypothetical protein
LPSISDKNPIKIWRRAILPKQNRWEFKKCGREAGGAKEKEFGTCPAVLIRELDENHGGKNAGRVCWIVAGTMCGGKVQGSFATKIDNCKKCVFFCSVEQEESSQSILVSLLLSKMRKTPTVSSTVYAFKNQDERLNII